MAKHQVAGAASDPKLQQAAAESAGRRAKGKKSKSQIKYYVAVGGGCAALLFAIVLALTEDNKGGRSKGFRPSPDDSLVNDASFIKGVNADAAGNFTAVASPFFNAWNYGHVKWGLDGVGIHGLGMIGMAGALQTCKQESELEGGAMPSSFDAREAWPGCVGDVYDAGNCSSSYAIAGATSLSSRFCVADVGKYKELKLSPQQVLSCDKKSKGCAGGGLDSVWGYLERRGLYPEECVPFAKGAKATCKTDCKEEQKIKALDHCLLNQGEKALKREIFNRGPVVAPVYVKDDFLVYEGGVYTPTRYARDQFGGVSNKPLLQGVVVIGWGKAEGTKYWLVQNSWGTSWGEQGYARIAVDTVIREEWAIVGTAATEEALEQKAQKEAEMAKKREEAKKERAEREERIQEARRKREEEARANADAEDMADLDADDLEDIDLDDAAEEEGDEVA